MTCLTLLASTTLATVFKGGNSAFKIMKDQEYNDLLETNLKVVENIKSDHLVKVKGLVTIEDRLALEMEFYENTLHKSLDLSYSTLTQIFFDVCKAVKALHVMNICHNDIKPANIFIDRNNRGYLGDLDLCSKSDLKTDSHFTTYSFAAPETYSDENIGYYSLAGDIWSLGCTLYFILTAKLLFNSTYEDYVSFFKNPYLYIDISPKEKDKEIKDKMKSLIGKMLQPINKRIAIDDVLKDDLFKDCQ